MNIDSLRSIPLECALDLGPLRNFVAEKVLPESRRCDESEVFPIHLFEELHRMGILQAFVPTELGGSGASTLDLAFIARELAYGSCGTFSSFVVNPLTLSPILLYGSPELRREVCGDFARRFCLCSFALTEAETGSEIAATRTVARKVPGGYLLNGDKSFITNAGISEHIVVLARGQDGPPGAKSLSTFYVPGGSPGIRRGKPYRKMGQRDSNTAPIRFEDVFVPEEHRIGAEGQGLRISFHSIQRSKTLISAAAVGVSLRASELVLGHLRERVLYGKRLLEEPSIHHLLARMHTELQAAWYLTCAAAARWDQGELCVLEASTAKSFNTNMAVGFINEALELFGGRGYLRDHEIEKLYRDCKLLEIYEGPTLVQQALIARELFPDLRAPRKDSSRQTPIKAA